MASAASVPTLANSVVGIFVARDDIGLGAVIGGALFNVFLIPAICSMCIPKSLQLKGFPILRDLAFMVLASLLLLWCVQDDVITVYESVTMILFYCLYLLVVIFTPRMEKAIYAFAERMPAVLDKCTCKCFDITLAHVATESTSLMDKETGSEYGETSPSSAYSSILAPPRGTVWRIFYVIFLPVLILFFLLIPDFQRPGWSRLYPLTIVMSLGFIAVCSYTTVWMTSIIGEVIGAPVTAMGMTLLAWGSSLPDAFNSVFAAKDGYGLMATSNAIGAVTSQLTLCLGVPWLVLVVLRMSRHRELRLGEDITFCTFLLVLSGLLMMYIFLFNRFYLTRRLGAACIVFYLAFIVTDVLTQGNNSMMGWL